jgi:NADPH-dependent ferric siderophore reductase
MPFRFFDLRVLRTERVGPSIVRITFGGEALAEFTSGGRDQRLKLFLPHPGQDVPVVPAGEDWFAAWRQADPAVRAVLRSYTVREQRRLPDEVDIDFAVHARGGPASTWAAGARPGDRAVVLGPVEPANPGIDFHPPDGTDWVLLTADETALPAVESILRALPAALPVLAWVEVPHAADMRDLPTDADAWITWLVGRDLLSAIGSTAFPTGTPYAWLAGEAGAVRSVRRQLVDERGFDRHTITFTGYWRRGATEEDLIAEALSESR